MTVLPRWVLSRALMLVIAAAIPVAMVEAALVYRAVGPVIAAALGVAISPALLRGARSGSMRPSVAWSLAVVGCVICFVGTMGLNPDRLDWVSIGWLSCGVLAGAVMVWMAGHRLAPLLAVGCLLLHLSTWAGLLGMLRLGVAVELVLVVAGLILHRTVRRVSEAADAAAAQERDLILWQVEHDAFRVERQTRLEAAAKNTTPMLRLIIATGGTLDEPSRLECRMLEQGLRDEIRGRRLLNDAVREIVLAHRRRGTTVQVLDDGGIDDLTRSAADSLLSELARRLADIRSGRIVIRTGQPDSTTAITVVASTADDTDVALGVDDDAAVDAWFTLPRPGAPVPIT